MKFNTTKLRVEAYKKGITQTALAKACNLSRGTINGIFNGRGCTEETAVKIADALSVSIDKVTL